MDIELFDFFFFLSSYVFIFSFSFSLSLSTFSFHPFLSFYHYISLFHFCLYLYLSMYLSMYLSIYLCSATGLQPAPWVCAEISAPYFTRRHPLSGDQSLIFITTRTNIALLCQQQTTTLPLHASPTDSQDWSGTLCKRGFFSVHLVGRYEGTKC